MIESFFADFARDDLILTMREYIDADDFFESMIDDDEMIDDDDLRALFIARIAIILN